MGGPIDIALRGGSMSFMTMTMTIWWPRSGVWIYQIVTGVTSVVSVPSTHLVWRVILRRLPGYCLICNKDQSIHFTNKPSRVVEIIGIRNDAIHEPIHGHLLIFLWQNAVSDLYIFDHPRVNISLGSMLERFHTAIKGGSLWDLKLCELRVLDN